MPISRSAKALSDYRSKLGRSARKAAEELGTSHNALRSWELGRANPNPLFREAIEVWSEGKVRADGWGLNAREREIVRRLDARPSTGTEG